MFLIRTAFWLAVVALVVPSPGPAETASGAVPEAPPVQAGRDTLTPADLEAEWRGPGHTVPI